MHRSPAGVLLYLLSVLSFNMFIRLRSILLDLVVYQFELESLASLRAVIPTYCSLEFSNVFQNFVQASSILVFNIIRLPIDKSAHIHKTVSTNNNLSVYYFFNSNTKTMHKPQPSPQTPSIAVPRESNTCRSVPRYSLWYWGGRSL